MFSLINFILRRAIKTTVIQKMNNRNRADGEVVSILTEAILKFEILRVKPHNPVNLKLPTLSADDAFAGSST